MMPSSSPNPKSYRHFNVAIYTRVYEVMEMGDLARLEATFEVIQRHINVDKIYLETHRDTLIADDTTLQVARSFFEARGIAVAGGITYTVNERNRFETYCYTRTDHRQKVREIAEHTARHFDEMILDDFFFTNCKCPTCIKAKGDCSWTDYRLQLMLAAAQELVLGPAKAVNPAVKVIIKYPNWYEHFQGLGFDLAEEPALFDGLYTGTETRDPVLSNQHLQPYHGYLIFRYFEALKPGGNGGGWVDTGGMATVDRYAEQLWLTLFAKAPEITLFDFRQMQWPIRLEHRAPWQDAPRTGQGLDFDAMIAPFQQADGTWSPEAVTVPLVAGTALAQVDGVLGELGEPLGVKSYKPFHSTGEDFLQSYLGMLGIPVELVPAFPDTAETVLLTEQARQDSAIVTRIKTHLLAGNNVVVTSGLYRALQGKPPGAANRIEDIVELEVTECKVRVREYLMGWRERVEAKAEILIPHVRYLTNDSWELVSGLTNTTGHPVLHDADYGRGHLYVLTIPDNFDDLYCFPEAVLSRIRAVLMADLDVRVDAPGQVALFVYDNDTFIVESFLPTPTVITIVLRGTADGVQDVVTGETLTGTAVQDWRDQPTGEVSFQTQVGPRAYRVFRSVRPAGRDERCGF